MAWRNPLNGRARCKECNMSFRVSEWAYPWNRIDGYTCERCGEQKQLDKESKRKLKKDREKANSERMEKEDSQKKYVAENHIDIIAHNGEWTIQFKGDQKHLKSLMSALPSEQRNCLPYDSNN